jgi:multidrug efflux pump subunit AcrA (membrane-fusion protein)
VLGRDQSEFRVVAAAHPKSEQQADWDCLSNFDDETQYCAAWLGIVCAKMPGAITGLVRLRDGVDGSQMRATWPESNLDLTDLDALAERTLSDQRTSISLGRSGRGTDQSQSVGLLVAVPLGSKGAPVGVAAVALSTVRGSSSVAPEKIAEQLRWATGWLEALLRDRRAQRLSEFSERASVCFDILAVASQYGSLKSSATAVINDLATRVRCDRVSIGFTRRSGDIRLLALSQSAGFQKKSSVAESIECAMQEALDQGVPIAQPAVQLDNAVISLAHHSLAKLAGSSAGSVMTAILTSSEGRQLGAITLERHDGVQLDIAAFKLVNAIAALLGPYFALHLSANRLLAGSIVNTAEQGLSKLVGPGRPTLKLAAAGLLVLGAFLTFAEGEHRVTAKAVLEGEFQRAAVAPFDGFVRIAPARAGDIVRKGDLLAALDDRDLVLDQMKWRAEREKLLQKAREALATHDRPTVVALRAQIDQAEAQLGLAEEKLARSRIIAPFDGIVVSGDLSQTLGAPTEKGKVLFELAPSDAYRLIVHVDERDVRYVAPGQAGHLALTGRPEDRIEFKIAKITPVTVAEEGRNTFRIEADMSESGTSLRPGMEGIAKIDAGVRSLVWIWSHPILEWCQLTLWKYLP